MADLVYSSDNLTPGVSNNVNEVKSIKTETAAYVNGPSWVNDARLASPLGPAYRTLVNQSTPLDSGDYSASTFILGAINGGSLVESGGNVLTTHSANGFMPLYLDAADYTVADKTTRLRVRAQLLVGGATWSTDAVVGLYPITLGGGASSCTVTLGTVVPGSTVTFTNPTGATANQGNSGDFSVPATGAYCLGFTLAGGSGMTGALLTAQLQLHHT